MTITINSIQAEVSGDWHDKPLRWAVYGPANEVQKFSTKKDAMLYKSIRSKVTSFQEASREFVKR